MKEGNFNITLQQVGYSYIGFGRTGSGLGLYHSFVISYFAMTPERHQFSYDGLAFRRWSFIRLSDLDYYDYTPIAVCT